MRFTSKVVIACLVLAGSFAAIAQNVPATGIYPFGSFDNKGFDTINRGNLNIHFTIPIIAKQGRGGANFYYALTYDGLIWSPTTTSGTTTWTPSEEWGWTDATNAEFGYVTYDLQYVQCSPLPQLKFEWQATNFYYHDAHGIAHFFPMAWSGTCGGSLPNPIPGTGSYSTIDNSGYTVYHTTGSYIAFARGGAQSAVLAYPAQNVDPIGSATFEDTNGNEITAAATGTFTDTTGKTVLTVTGSGTASSPTVYTYTDSNGNSDTVTVHYTNYSIKTNFGVSGTGEYSQSGVPLVSSIVYPDGSSYVFTYEATPGTPSDTTGRIASIALRTGGKISYAYTGGSNNSGIEPDGTTAELKRITTDAPTVPTTYTRSGISGTASTTTIVNPAGNTGVYTFYENANGFFYENEHSLYNAGATGTPIEKVTACYNSPCSSVNAEFSTVSSTTVRDGVTIGTDTQTYTAAGLLASDAGPTGITTTNTYDTLTGPYSVPFYRLATQTITTSGTRNAETDYDYDETAVTAKPGLVQHVAPGGQRGNLTSIHRLVSGTTKITTATATYDGAGQVLTAKDANGNTTSYAYDSGTDTFLTQLTRPVTNNNVPNLSVNVSHVSSATYNIQSGLMLSSTDENGNTTTYTYDGLERPATIGYPDGGQTTYTYTPYSSSAPASTTQAVLQSGSTTLDTTVDVDGYGRTIHVYSPNGSVVDTTYDPAGRVSTVSNPHFSTGSPTDGATTYSYDGLGRVIGVQNADATTRSTSFHGETETLTDETGNKKEYIADALGRIVEVLEPNTAGALTWETDYTWNALNELHIVTQKGDGSGTARARTFSYNNEGLLISQATPEQGTTTFGYDDNGNLTSRVDARSITTTYTYDALDRKLTEVAPNINYKYFWDEEVGTTTHNSIGRLVNESNWVNADEVYSYDPMGRVNWEASWTPSQPNSTGIIAQAGYDKAGEMTSLTYPDGRVVANAYPSGQLSSVTYTGWNTQSESVPYLSSASYGPPGNLTGETFGNGVQMVAANNSRVLLNSLQYKTSTATLWSKQYTWAGNGMNLTKLTDALNSANTMTYTYDPDNRIASASGAGASETYSADAWGNLKQSGNPFSFTQSFNSSNRISTGGYSYDAAGDLTADGDGTTYTYNADGMITTSGGASYTYDALEQRVAKTGGSNPGETIYFNGAPIALHNPSNPPTDAFTDLIYANGTMIAEVAGTQTAVPTYRVSDHLGSLALQTDNSGGVTGTSEFLPFGQTLTETTSDQFQFIGLPQDTENSSYHAGYRNFSYEQGRWLSPDPYNGSYDIANPQSFNRYSYVNNNPMAFIDPSGLDAYELVTCTYTPILWSDGTEVDVLDGCESEMFGGGGGGGGGGTAAHESGGGGGSVTSGTSNGNISSCTISNGRTTAVSPDQYAELGSGPFGLAPRPPAASVAIDPWSLGLFPGQTTNDLLGPYASQITFSFNPTPNLPQGFPTTFTLGSIAGPKSVRVGGSQFNGLYDFDIFGLPSLNAAYAASSGPVSVTITYPSSLPITCGGPTVDSPMPAPIGAPPEPVSAVRRRQQW